MENNKNSCMNFRTDIEFYKRAYISGKTPWPSDFPEEQFVRFLNDYLRDYKPCVCVDMGCGEGRHAKLLKDFFKDSLVLGFDVIMEPLKNAVKKANNSYFAVANVFFIPVRSEVVDLALDFGLFHHVRRKDGRYYKEELNRILKPQGIFLIGVFSEKFKHYEGERRKRDFLFHRGHYDRFFTPKTLEQEFDFLQKIEICEWGRGLEWFIYGIFRKK